MTTLTSKLSPVSTVDTVDLNSTMAQSSVLNYNSTSSITGTGYTWGNITSPNTASLWTITAAGTSTNTLDALRPSGKLDLKGDDADIVVNGRSLCDAIAALEARLNVLVPNPKLEAEWDELRELGERYRALEKNIQEKVKTWEILSKIS